MAPDMQAVVGAAQAWLQSSRNIQVPFAWLEACVEWLQQEAGGAARPLQQQINQQVLDQWLLTDLRDLDHPVLPEGLSQAQKTELSGNFCVQVDSLLDVSQPAYGQLLKWRGTDCSNDEVSAVSLTTQRPWEAKPTRMLLLQVTDGVQSLEAMEYQPIPSISGDLRPGAKLQLQGTIVCRLGMLLLGPSNVTLLGGEVEDLVERNNPNRMLCRTLGLPEEQQQQNDEEEDTAAAQPVNQAEEEDELDDAELLASLEAQEEARLPQVSAAAESGYGTLSLSSRSSSARSLPSTVSSRGDFSTSSNRSGLRQSNIVDAFQGHRGRNEAEVVNYPPAFVTQEETRSHNMEEDFPDDEEFADIPLDELDSEIFLGNETESNDQMGNNTRCHSQAGTSTEPLLVSHHSRTTHVVTGAENLDEDMECVFDEVEACVGQTQLPVQQGPSTERWSSRSNQAAFTGSRFSSISSNCLTDSSFPRTETSIEVTQHTPRGQSHSSSTADSSRLSSKPDPDSNHRECPVTPTSPPFTYLCLIEKLTCKSPKEAIEIRVKAFIVTLSGKLSSNNSLWSVSATISDGSSYLDVELSNEVLTNLLGFSVAEKGALKRDPARRAEFDAGMKRCQEELVDMCSVMTIVVEPNGKKPVVTNAEPVSEKMLHELEQRTRMKV